MQPKCHSQSSLLKKLRSSCLILHNHMSSYLRRTSCHPAKQPLPIICSSLAHPGTNMTAPWPDDFRSSTEYPKLLFRSLSASESRPSGHLEELDQLGREYNLGIPSRAAPSIPFPFLFQSYPVFQSDIGDARTEARSGIQRPSSDTAFACICPSTQLSRHSSETEAFPTVRQESNRLCTQCSVLLPSVLSEKQPLRKSHS